MVGQCHKKLLVNGFKLVREKTQINEYLIKSYNEEKDHKYFFEVDFNILKIYIIFITVYHFYVKE